ncbi:hypothetical protein BOX15_Mlig001673g3 [Macrostomum lignano]|nr:hypothetical protein BOX15_Mlig001673g1 [Macrostomum lignano]PAA87266.1 hypothetical protein BOX15_Mlig001673g3 [Macrostomum lignano]
MSNQFKHGLCGCFDDFGLCIVTYLVPCYTFGKNAEAVQESCLLCGIGYLFVSPCLGAIVRGKIREKQGIPGRFVSDLLAHLCCPLCALMQDAQEVKAMAPAGSAVERE